MKELRTIHIQTHRNNIIPENVDESIYLHYDEVQRFLSSELDNYRFGYIFFYDSSFPKEILVVAFNPTTVSTKRDIEVTISRIKEMIYEYGSLLEAYEQFNPRGERSDYNYIIRYQLLRLSRNWRDIIENEDYPRFKGFKQKSYSSRDLEIVNLISNNIHEHRIELVKKLDEANNEIERETAEFEFDKSVLSELDRFVEAVDLSNIEIELSPLIKNHGNCLEPETIIFIQSVEKVEKYLLSKGLKILSNFDFTCIGVPLWKAIELELNASIVKFLRLQFGIIDKYNPNQNRILKGGQLRVNGLSLNDVDGNNDLRSLMFGGLKRIIQQSNKNSLKESLENELYPQSILDFILDRTRIDCLPKRVEIIHSIRNPHSHIKPMSYENFKELRSSVIEPELSPEKSTLGKIAEFKCEMKKKI